MGGVGSFWGGGAKRARGSDVVMEFLSDAPAPRRHPRSPTAQPNRKPRRIPAASGPREPPSRTIRANPTTERDEIWVSNGDLTKFRTRRLAPHNSNPPGFHAMCVASQPPCHRRVPGRRLRKETSPPPTQNFWPALNLKEQSNLVKGGGTRTSYERSTDLICDMWHSSRSNA